MRRPLCTGLRRQSPLAGHWTCPRASDPHPGTERGLRAEPWLRREVTRLPPEKGAGGTIPGKLRLRALTPPRGPSLSPGWPWVLLTGHPCSCLQTQSVTHAPRPGPGSPSAAPGPRPTGIGFLRAGPAAHSWQRAGGWEPEKAASPRIPRRGSPIRASPCVLSPQLPSASVPPRGKEAGPARIPAQGPPHVCLPKPPFFPSRPRAVSGGPPGSAQGAAPSAHPVPWRLCALLPACPGSSVSLMSPVRPAQGAPLRPPTGLRKALELSGQERGRRKEASWTVGTGVPGGGDGPGGHPPCPAFW